jgi:hypothetical protein
VGRLCTRCRGNLERDVRTAPSIVDWIREHVEPSRQQALMQESTAKNPRPRTDSEGAFYMRLASKSRAAEGIEPLAASAVDDADGLHAMLASWALLILEEHPSQLVGPTLHGSRTTEPTLRRIHGGNAEDGTDWSEVYYHRSEVAGLGAVAIVVDEVPDKSNPWRQIGVAPPRPESTWEFAPGARCKFSDLLVSQCGCGRPHEETA